MLLHRIVDTTDIKQWLKGLNQLLDMYPKFKWCLTVEILKLFMRSMSLEGLTHNDEPLVIIQHFTNSQKSAVQYFRKVFNGQAYIHGPSKSGNVFLTLSIIRLALMLLRRVRKKIPILVVALSSSALNYVVHVFDWVYTNFRTIRYLRRRSM